MLNRQVNRITFIVAVRTKRIRAAKMFQELRQVSGQNVTSFVFSSRSILTSRSADLSVVVGKVVVEADEVMVVGGEKVPEELEVLVMEVAGVVNAMVEEKVGSEAGSVRFFFKWWFIFFSLGVVKVSNLGFWSKF